MLAWGWGGGWRRWRCSNFEQEGQSSLQGEKWHEVGAVTGHNGPIKGIAWSPKGEYIISAGADQTTRIHGPIKDASGLETWHELARPQVHGYDMVDVTFLSALSFVSIADEKVIRVFEAPKSFVDTLDGLGIVNFSDTEVSEIYLKSREDQCSDIWTVETTPTGRKRTCPRTFE